MTPQERELLTNLVARLKQAPPVETDQEAAAMIRDLVRDLPDAPYLLAQTVLIQDFALHQAQSRIAELERQAQPQRSGGGGSFLGAIFGSAASSRPQPAPQPQATQAPAYTQAPPAYAQPQPGPWGGGGPFAQSSGPSFLRSAAATAAGVAGGALLFQGIESLFGMGHGGFGGAAPGLTETVVNNYYGDAAPGADGTDLRDADAVPADDQGVQDADYQDDGSQDFGGDDFGGGGDDTVGV